MNELVFRWSRDFGRMGGLEGIFVATQAEVNYALGRRAYFGEVLGKHSEIYCNLEAEQFESLSDEPSVVAFVEQHGPFGRNPLDYVTIECDGCGEPMHIDEVQDYWCKSCELRICYSCKRSDDHDGHTVEEYVGQTSGEEAEDSDEA